MKFDAGVVNVINGELVLAHCVLELLLIAIAGGGVNTLKV